MKRVCTTLSLLLRVTLAAISTCQQQNWLGVIGGSSYTVNSIYIAANNQRHDIAAGGLLTKNSPSTPVAFFYIFSTQACQLIVQNQFPSYVGGIQAISYTPDWWQVAMVAYSATAEYLIVVETTSPDFETWIYQTQSGPTIDYVRPLSLLTSGYEKYFIVGAQKIRKMFTQYSGVGADRKLLDFNSQKIKCATSNTQFVYALLQNGSVSSIVLAKLNFNLEVLGVFSQNNGVSTTWADNEARMSNAVGSSSGFTAISTCLHGLSGKVQFTRYVSRDAAPHDTTQKTYKTTSWAQCLGVKAQDGINANYILIDSSLNLWLYKINFDTGALQAFKTNTPAVTGWQGLSDRRSSAVITPTVNLIFGRVDQILGINKGYVLGFVRIAEENDWYIEVSPALSSDTLTIDPTPNLGHGVVQTEAAYAESTVNLKQNLKSSELNKAMWTTDFCPNVVKQVKTTYCNYWAIYDNANATSYLDTTRAGVQTQNVSCPQGNDDYIDYSVILPAIRKVCFPYYYKSVPSIPYDNPSGTYMIDSSGTFLSWPRTIVSSLANQQVQVVYQTDSDDQVNYPGDHLSITFVGQTIASNVYYIQRGVTVNQLVVNPSLSNYDYTFQVKCWSKRCPGKLVLRNDTMYADSSDVCGSELNEAYIYVVQIDYTTLGISQIQTHTFNFTCTAINSGINITLPWVQYVMVYGKSGKFRPTPLTEEQIADFYAKPSFLPTEAFLTSSDGSVDSYELSVISKWTSEQLVTAVVEAEARMKKIPKSVVMSAEIGNQGNVKISFSNPVSLPSYLQFDSGKVLASLNETEQNQTNSTNETSPEDATGNSRRRRRMRGQCMNGACGDLPAFTSQATNTAPSPQTIQGTSTPLPSSTSGAGTQQQPASGGGQSGGQPGGQTGGQQSGGGASGDSKGGSGGAQQGGGGSGSQQQGSGGSGSQQEGKGGQGSQQQGGGGSGSQQQGKGGQGSQQQGGGSAESQQQGGQQRGPGGCVKKLKSVMLQSKPGGEAGGAPSGGGGAGGGVGEPGSSKDSGQGQAGQGDKECEPDTQGVPGEAVPPPLDCTLQENFQAKECANFIPTCQFGFYFEKETRSCQKYQIFFGQWKDLVQVKIIPDPERDPDQALKDLAYTFSVAATSVDHIDIQLDFVYPLKVSTRDKVQIGLSFSQIEPALPGVARRLRAKPGVTFFEAQMTPQLPIGGGKTIENAAASVQVATIATVVSSAILQIVLSGALAQIWGMINGIQIIIYLPLLAVQFPANALIVIDKILIVANFDIPYLNMQDIFGDLWDFGEDDSVLDDLKDNELVVGGFDAMGFSSRILSVNLGSVFIFMSLSFWLLLLIGVIEFFSQKLIHYMPCLQEGSKGHKIHAWLKKKFLWNYYIRLFFECILQMVIACWFNVKYGNFWATNTPQTAATGICLALALWWSVVVCGLPIFIMAFYWHHFEKLKREEFEDTWGCVYEGLTADSRLVLVMPLFFVLRRICFLIIVIGGYQFIWLQVMSQLAFCFFSLIFVYLNRPFEEDITNKLDMFNEVTTVVLLYIIYNFSDLIPDEENRYLVGYFFVAILFINLSVHLTLIGISIFKDLRDKFKEWHVKCQKRREKDKHQKSKRIIVEGTDIVRDEQMFVLRKKSESESVVESSGELESLSDLQKPQSVAASDSELLQGEMRRFQLQPTLPKLLQSSDSDDIENQDQILSTSRAWKIVSERLDNIRDSNITPIKAETSVASFFLQSLVVNDPRTFDDSMNRIETDN